MLEGDFLPAERNDLSEKIIANRLAARAGPA